MRTSLESKTIRPGLLAYSSYHSDRHPMSRSLNSAAKPKSGGRKLTTLLFIAAIGLGLILGFKTVVSQQSNNVDPNARAGKQTASGSGGASPASTPGATSVTSNHCAGNVQAQFIVVSISTRHMWACQGQKVVYDTPVVTGMEQYAADKTPTGTYHIYAKQTDTTLTGSDNTGNWSDPVHYWMPFLNNQYGTYGFHDATWRPDTAFGHIDPNSTQASHGCVELPLAASTWLYNWAQVGTTLTIEN